MDITTVATDAAIVLLAVFVLCVQPENVINLLAAFVVLAMSIATLMQDWRDLL